MTTKKKTDKERLDWLTRRRAIVYRLSETDWVCEIPKYDPRQLCAIAKSPRAAIDAAMSQEAKGKRGRG